MRSAEHSCRSFQRGFTLLEVLAALVIVALGMLGVIQAVSQTASNTSYLRDKTVAHWVAMNQLTEARLAAQQPKIGKTSDDVEMAGRTWRWTMEVTQTPLESMRRIEVRVRPEDADEKYSMATVNGFYGTAIAQPGTTMIAWQGGDGEQSGGDNNEGDGTKDEDKNPQQPPPGSDPQPEPDGEPVDMPPEPEPEPEPSN